ncbi:MAG: histidine kinase [Sediminibacterium sp.]
MRILVVSLLFVLFSSAVVTAQENDAWIQRIENVDAIKQDSIAIDSLRYLFNLKALNPNQKLAVANKLAFRLATANRYAEGLKFCQENISSSRANKADSAECLYTKLMGITYYFMQQKKDALLYFDKALQLATQKGYYQLAYSCLSNMGGILLEEKAYNRAEKALLHALALMQEHHAKQEELFITKRLLATLYDYQGKPVAAENIYKATIEESLSKNDSISAAHAMTFYADLLWKQKQYQKAISVGRQAIEIERKTNNKKNLLASLTMQRKHLSGQQQFRELASLDSEIIALQSTVFSTDLNKQISETEVKYKLNELVLKEINTKKTQQLILVAFAGLSLAGIFIFWGISQRNKAKQQSRLETEKTAAVILGEEQERIRMAAELHDGVGQMMSAAKMKLSSLEHAFDGSEQDVQERYESAIALVDASCAEIRQIAHNLAPFWVMKLGFEEALKRLTQKTEGSQVRINLYADPLPDTLDKVLTSTLFRVIQECVSNALKYAGCSIIDIAVNLDNENLSVTIEDDGIGFDVHAQNTNAGLGMENIRNRIRYLNGTVEWDSSPGNGTLVAINIPVKTERV